MSKAFCCPCCGHALPDRMDPHKLIEHLPVAGLRRAILRTLAANFGREVPTSVICDRAWSNEIDGGPLTATNAVRVHTCSLRKILAPYGLTIRGRTGRWDGGGTHRLDWIDSPAFAKYRRSHRKPKEA